MKRDPSLVRLSRDHQRGLALALRIDRELPAADADRLASLLTEVTAYATASLLPHFRAECECLLARLVRHVTADDDLVVRTQRDHLSILALLTELADDAGDGRERLVELAALLRRHIRWEESVLFEAAQSTLTAGELSAVGADLSERLPAVPPPPPWLSGERPTS